MATRRGPRPRHAGAEASRRYATALAALSVVGLLLLGRFAFAAHMLLVPHLVGADGSLHHHGSRAEVELGGAVDHFAIGRPSVRLDDEGDTERCEVLGLKEAPPTTAMPPTIGQGLEWWLLVATAPTVVDVEGVALLLLAPKLSPPTGPHGR